MNTEFEDFVVKMIFALIVFFFGVIPTMLFVSGHTIAAVIYYVVAMTIHIMICNWSYNKNYR